MHWKQIGLAALALAAAAPRAQGQTTNQPTLTLEGAKAVAAAATAEARRLQAPGGAIAVVDNGGAVLYVERLDNTFPASAEISVRKAQTAARFRRPSKQLEDAIAGGRTTLLAVADAPLQGGVPIVVDGAVVGAVGVSGAASAAQDEEIAVAAAAGLMNRATMAGDIREVVTYFPAADVSTAFARGVPLLEVPGYKIHASRRAAAGQAEVHERDTDIIYVLEGSATFVTGGSVVDGKTTTPDELRGAAITGGETRRLVKGDVMVVPQGTPHWFQEVRGPFLYYVVKVTGGT